MRSSLAAVAAVGLVAAAAPATLVPAAAARVDGISDQSLPAWEGDFQTSMLAGALRAAPLTGEARHGLALARYVVQWDALLRRGDGGYAARFEAWLADTGSLGLRPVVALTSYDGVYPPSLGAYAAGLRAVLARAQALGRPIAWIEPWNEPDVQGAVPPAVAAADADAAAAVCGASGAGCGVIAGDFADGPGAPAYARAYVRALGFAPADWGVHPYSSVAKRDLRPLLALLAELPPQASGRRLWITEVAALRCKRGEVLGDVSQAADAAFLVDHLLTDPAIAPVHAFYYGLQFRDRQQAPCAPDGGEDGELFEPGGAPRPAAAIVFPQLAGEGRAAAFGPGPGAAAGSAAGAAVGVAPAGSGASARVGGAAAG
jgi:hypothetical protein